jgi:6-phosphogluconolactonase/glucosamine-6-phosphate isomerase/deaminase
MRWYATGDAGEAVAGCLQREISSRYPASILRTHPRAIVYLDRESSSLLKAQ